MNQTNSEIINRTNLTRNNSDKPDSQSDLLRITDKFEPYLFWILVFIGTLPILLNKYYPTLDGPSHLYNGNIIKELISGNHTEFGNLFSFNPVLVPNWISHFLFAIFSFVLPDYLTEKVVLLGYFILTPFFFRKVCLTITPENKLLTYLMIPFAHNHLFYFGFFNFTIAITLMLATIYFGLKIQNHFRINHILKLASLFLLVYFSHVMVLMITVFLLFLLPIRELNLNKKNGKYEITGFRQFMHNFGFTFAAALPAILLTINYILKIDSLEQASRVDLITLLKMILDVRPLMTLAYGFPWKTYNWILMLTFGILIATNLIHTFRQHKLKSETLFRFPTPRFPALWLLIALAFTVVFLTVPNANLLTERLILILYIFFILGIATLTYPRKLQTFALFIVLIVQIAYVKMHASDFRDLSNVVKKIKETTTHIESGSLLLTFNYSDNWYNAHTAGYFGSGKPIAVIENYEGQLKWFPLQWNLKGKYDLSALDVWGVENKKIIDRIYSNSLNPDVFSLPQKDGKIQEIPYAVIFGKMPDETDPDFQKIKPILDKSYKLIFQNDFCWLYRLGKN